LSKNKKMTLNKHDKQVNLSCQGLKQKDKQHTSMNQNPHARPSY